jgi:nitroreductase
MLELIKKRRSIRKYTAEDVSDEQVRMMLEAAMAAPSASNLRPWHFVVVRDAGRRAELAKSHRWSYMCADAPVVFAVVGDPQASEHWVEDASAATENLLLLVAGIGLGGVWMATYPHEERESHVRRTLGIPDGLRILCLVAVGHPAEEKKPRTQYDESRVHREVWGKV